MRRSIILIKFLVLVNAFMSGCNLMTAVRPTPTPSVSPSLTPSYTPSRTPTIAPTSTPTSTTTASPTITHSPTLTGTATNTPTPTLLPPRTASPIVRGRVLVQSNCRYGPGSAYLYEWGLYPKNRVTVLGRNQDGTWIYVDPWTYIDFCWVKTDLLELDGDVMGLSELEPVLPFGELYWPPTNVRASRNDDEVMVAWNLVPMTEDDDRGYLIEAWLCQDGEIRFTPLHYWASPAFLHDERGCSEPSHARIYTAEKHGYTQWVIIPWPPHPTPEKTKEIEP